jgi:hypothetical protein
MLAATAHALGLNFTYVEELVVEIEIEDLP